MSGLACWRLVRDDRLLVDEVVGWVAAVLDRALIRSAARYDPEAAR
jgi:hypothetical protein